MHNQGCRLIEDLPLVYSSILHKLLYPIFQKLSEDYPVIHTAQKMKFSIKDFSSKCDQIRSFLLIWSHLLENSLMENFIFCAVP